jgi:hypothetical protein
MQVKVTFGQNLEKGLTVKVNVCKVLIGLIVEVAIGESSLRWESTLWL